MIPMTEIKALVVEPNGNVNLVGVEPSLDAMKNLIGGGWLEAVSGEMGTWVAYGDEEGRLKGQQPNGLAVGLIQALRPDQPVIVVGTIVFVGMRYVGPEDGYTESDVPRNVAELAIPQHLHHLLDTLDLPD